MGRVRIALLAALVGLLLAPAAALRRAYSARVRIGRVMSQRPVAGRLLARYTRVSVVLSRGKK